MVCPNCGMENEKDAALCAQCGQPLEQKKANYGKDFAWAALVLGIWSMLFYPYLFTPLTVLAGALAKRQGYEGKMGLVGVVLSLVGLAGWAVFRIVT